MISGPSTTADFVDFHLLVPAFFKFYSSGLLIEVTPPRHRSIGKLGTGQYNRCCFENVQCFDHMLHTYDV